MDKLFIDSVYQHIEDFQAAVINIFNQCFSFQID
jgi:hypothetical protein